MDRSTTQTQIKALSQSGCSAKNRNHSREAEQKVKMTEQHSCSLATVKVVLLHRAMIKHQVWLILPLSTKPEFSIVVMMLQIMPTLFLDQLLLQVSPPYSHSLYRVIERATPCYV